jgi:hypothetical protein
MVPIRVSAASQILPVRGPRNTDCLLSHQWLQALNDGLRGTCARGPQMMDGGRLARGRRSTDVDHCLSEDWKLSIAPAKVSILMAPGYQNGNRQKR